MLKMLKRFVAFTLALALAMPAFFGREAEALTTPNYTLEPYSFIQRGTEELVPVDPFHTPSPLVEMTEDLQNNASWARAAIAVLETAAKNASMPKTFSASDLMSATSNKVSGNSLGFDRAVNGPGNRAMLTAYLMRGQSGGPLATGDDRTQLQQVKPLNPVKGVVYIPDLAATAGDSAKALYRNRIKNAIKASGAVAASLYFEPSMLGEVVDADNGNVSVFVYKNTTRRAADHTVAIIGWDESINFKYTYPVQTGTGDNISYTDKPEEVTGAFLVYDSININSDPYWVSYDTILSGAYYIEGFYKSSDFTPVTQPFESGTTKNPLELTYEYDAFGQTSALGYNSGTAYFANVFQAKTQGEALQAVSLFLTGEGNTFDIYFVENYKDNDSLKDAVTSGTKIATGTKALPGYYTIPIGSTPVLPAQGKKFAIVAKVTCATGTSPVPIQSTTLASAATGRGYMSADGTAWTDAYGQGQASVCLKAHTEKDITVNLESIALAQSPVSDESDDKLFIAPDAVNSNTDLPTGGVGLVDGKYPHLKIAPGQTYNVGPIYTPASANNVLTSKTEWAVYMTYATRDDEGYLIVDNDKKPVMSTTPEWLVWNEKWKMFLPASHEGETPPNGFKPNTAMIGDDEKPTVIEAYVEQPISITVSNGIGTIKLSKEEANFGKQIMVRATVSTGTRTGSGATEFKKTTDDSDFAVAGTKEAYTLVELNDIAVKEIKIDKTTASLKAGGTVTLKATINAEASPRKIIWCVAATKDYDNYEATFDPADPYNDKGPIAIVSEAGKVTAMRDGTCYVYAKVDMGNNNVVTSPPCKITIAKAAPTGISLNKKKMTMSNGSILTLVATVKPASASDKKVEWSSDKPEIVYVDPATGEMTALKVGTATITAKNSKNHKVSCVVTVNDAPTAIIKQGKSATYSVLGAASNAEVKWTWSNETPSEEGEEVFTKTDTSKCKVTASSVGSATLTGVLYAPRYNADGSVSTVDKTPIRTQSWNLASTVAISKLAFMDGEDIVKKVTLCIDSKKARPETITLSVAAIKPTDATLLDFEWSSKKTNVATVVADPDNNGTATITATGVGSTKITALNYNGNKKVSITIKVLLYPASITPKARSVQVFTGKSVSVKAKPVGRNIIKDLEYTLTDKDGNPLDEDNDIVYLDAKKAKITAMNVGEVVLVIKAAPYDDTAATVKIPIKVKEKPSK